MTQDYDHPKPVDVVIYIYTIVLQMSTSQLNNSTTFLRCRVRRFFQRKRIFIIFTIFSETIFKITKLVTKLSWHRPWDCFKRIPRMV